MSSHEHEQRELRNFVDREVLLNQSYLVEALFRDELISWEEVENLYATCRERGDELCEGCQAGKDCEATEIQEIYEWWVVSNWLAEKLSEHSEPILESAYGVWWGRTTTGQAIWLDDVISGIWDEIA